MKFVDFLDASFFFFSSSSGNFPKMNYPPFDSSFVVFRGDGPGEPRKFAREVGSSLSYSWESSFSP